MIKKEELMLKNWVDCNGVFAQVVGMTDEYLQTTYRTAIYLYSQIQPIPLTPEILEKAGFKRIGANQMRCGKYCFDFDTMQLYDRNAVGMIYNIAICEYLHQIQNLALALTGSPLNVKM